MNLPFNLKDIKKGDFSYLTRRKLKNAQDEETGEILLWKWKEKEASEYVLRCPFCQTEQQGEITLVRRPYRLRCSNCNRSITLPKLISQAKKEAKKGG
jgi:hypothetical protein